MHNAELDEAEFFEGLHASGARVLLIGRRALVALGLPVLTADYDLWLHIDDIEIVNGVAERLEHFPDVPSEEARRRGRYVLENGDRVDVIVAPSPTTQDGDVVRFEDVWGRRQHLAFGTGGAFVTLPAISDLIRTKRWSMRPRDLIEIDALEALEQSKVGRS
ncbi:hypothetical protein [Pendulispora albinea]|uniref:Nucleotidyltransferase family protein n=1 Tax=Pendulispora albinea TaxID=2741071 RepID=A0ABZ2LZF9_9BACT